MTASKSPRPPAIARRTFLGRAATAATAAAVLGHKATPAGAASTEKLDIAFMGLKSRGTALLQEFLATQRVNVAWLCDIDQTVLDTVAATVKEKQVRAFKTTHDIRRVLEDRRLAGVVIATPDHWHAPAAILALKAGKPVYVEKPLSHNPREGELLVEVQKRTRIPVQVGLQRRSIPWVREAIAKVQSEEIGRVRTARAWYSADRKSIGTGQLAPVPSNLSFPLWQGPAPARPYRDNLIHYNWHWFWHWGTGELGNNGVHFLDLARWALQLDCPTRVLSSGGRFHFEDDQETPDTQFVTFEFPDRILTWEHRSCQPTPMEGEAAGIAFHGSKATLVIGGSGYRILDLKGRETSRVDGGTPTQPHVLNFLDAIEDRGKSVSAPAIEGHLSTLLCHLGNIAQRTGQTLRLNPQSRQLLGKDQTEAAKLWSREYEPGWLPTP